MLIRDYSIFKEQLFYDVIKDKIYDIYDFLYEELEKNSWKNETLKNMYACFQVEYPDQYIDWAEKSDIIDLCDYEYE